VSECKWLFLYSVHDSLETFGNICRLIIFPIHGTFVFGFVAVCRKFVKDCICILNAILPYGLDVVVSMYHAIYIKSISSPMIVVLYYTYQGPLVPLDPETWKRRLRPTESHLLAKKLASLRAGNTNPITEAPVHQLAFSV
jgi:hypothetical protein